MNVKMKDTVREWLAEYKSLAESSIPIYAAAISQRKDVFDSLIQLFSSCTKTSENDLIQPVCHQLFEFYRSKHEELKIFTINLLPAIMLSHIIVSTSTTEVIPTGTLLLSIYTIENNFEESGDSPGIEIPQLASPSVYHDSMSSVFSERTVKNRDRGLLYYKRPFSPKYEDILPYNQFEILNLLLTVYCKYVCALDPLSHISLCKCCAFLACCGFPWQSKYLSKSECEKAADIKRRIPLGADFGLTLLQGVYFALYNNCWREAINAVEAMKRRAKRELNSQVLMLSSAILNTASIEEKDQKFTRKGENVMPYGLGGQLTPILSRQISRRSFRSRTAVTAKSIRDHKWQHHSEEISGDLSKSLRSTDLNETGSTINTSINPDDSSKLEKHPSPAKILKSKLKKSIPVGSTASTSEKIRNPAPAPSGTQDKKANRKSQNISEELEQEKQKHSPSLKTETSKKSVTPVATKKQSKISSSQKQTSFDESIMLTTITKSKGNTFSKSTSDPVGPTVTGSSSHNNSIADTSYNPNEPSIKHNTSGSPLLGSKQESSTNESDGDEQNTAGEKRESTPLLGGSENSTKQKDVEQTGF